MKLDYDINYFDPYEDEDENEEDEAYRLEQELDRQELDLLDHLQECFPQFDIYRKGMAPRFPFSPGSLRQLPQPETDSEAHEPALKR